jgi:hypothetical protein
LRLLTLDIETRPNLAHVWALWDQNVGLSQIVEVGSVICFAAKWHGERKVHFASDHHDGHEAMITRAHELMDEADASSSSPATSSSTSPRSSASAPR